jgi:hypothetical protein
MSRYIPSGANKRASVEDDKVSDKYRKAGLNLRRDVEHVMLRVPSMSYPLINSESSSQSAERQSGNPVSPRKSLKLLSDIGETDITVSRLPEEHERISDKNIEMSMVDGTWNMRRVVWTKSKIAFARVGEDRMIDAIPLDQVDSVQAMVHEFDSSSLVLDVHCDAKRFETSENPIAACPRLDIAVNFIKIHTVQDGFNSGRPYFLRFPEEDMCRQVANELTQLAAAERRRVEAKSRFERHQASAALPPSSHTASTAIASATALFAPLRAALPTLPHSARALAQLL